MKKSHISMDFLPILILILLLLVLVPTVMAAPTQQQLDVSVLQGSFYDFFNILSQQGNIPVAKTYAGATEWYKFWEPNTYMKPETVFLASRANYVEVRSTTADPPSLLEDQRPKLAGWNADGTIPTWDKAYLPLYAIWLNRNCISLSQMIKDPAFAKLWLAVLMKNGHIDRIGNISPKAKAALRNLGFSDTTGLPRSYQGEDLMKDIESITIQSALAEIDFMPDEKVTKPEGMESPVPRTETLSAEEIADGVKSVAIIGTVKRQKSFLEKIPLILWCIAGILLVVFICAVAFAHRKDKAEAH